LKDCTALQRQFLQEIHDTISSYCVCHQNIQDAGLYNIGSWILLKNTNCVRFNQIGDGKLYRMECMYANNWLSTEIIFLGNINLHLRFIFFLQKVFLTLNSTQPHHVSTHTKPSLPVSSLTAVC